MELLTRLPKLSGQPRIDYDARMVSLGSCFAVHMAEKFDYFGFRHTVNPFGILFSPDAIEKVLRFAVSDKKFTGLDLFFHDERWHCFDAHSDLSGPKEAVLSSLNDAVSLLRNRVADASHVIITLGTAWVYRHTATDTLVANCHKVPQRDFTKELRSVEDIAASVRAMMAHIRQLRPEAHILFTLSPVRHIKDGFVENQRSKAHLIAGLHEALSDAMHASYFPSYELMMDELRDYRFYAPDMLHPNELALSYIWERFADAWIAPEVLPIMEEVEAIRKGLAHRPFNRESDTHRRFRETLEARIIALQQRFPHLFF